MNVRVRGAGIETPRRTAGLLLSGLALVALATLAPWPPGGNAGLEAPPTLEVHGELAVADLRGQALAIIDLASGESRHIELPGGPHELLLLPDGRLVASLEQHGSLAFVDVASGHVDAIRTGGLPHGLAFDGGILYVTDRSVAATRRFFLDGWQELDPLPSGEQPHALGIAEGGALAVANAADGTLSIGRHTRAVSALPETVAVSPRGERIAVAGAFGGRLQTFASDGTPLLDVALGGRPVRALFTPRGDGLAVALSATGQVALIDDAGAIRRIEVGGTPDGLAYAMDGAVLLVSDLQAGLVSLIDVASGRVVRRYDAGASAGALLLLAR